MDDMINRISALPIWQEGFQCKPLSGGLTNHNYLVSDKSGQYVVRLGEDIVEHHVMRFNELAASRAAHASGLSPAVHYAQTGIMVLEYIPSTTFTSKDIRNPDNLERIVALIKQCHSDTQNFLRGPILAFNVFHIIRDYALTLKEGASPHMPLLDALLETARTLEQVQITHPLVFGHNDLVAANFLDDGHRLWLIDWDYAGFNSPIFDLANLASNNEFDRPLEMHLLELYFDTRPDEVLSQSYQAMKCASLLREAMWSMVSELHSQIDHDFLTYTKENLSRFDEACAHLGIDRL